MAGILINGQNYAYSDLSFIVFGFPLIGITEINFSRKRARKNNYGQGNEPIGYGYENYMYEGDLTVYIEEIKAIQAKAPNKSILEIPPFSGTLMYSGDGVAFSTDILQNISFTEDNFASKQGDTAITVKLPFIYAGLKHL